MHNLFWLRSGPKNGCVGGQAKPKAKLITGKWLDERLAHQQLQIKFNDTEHESRLKQLLSNC